MRSISPSWQIMEVPRGPLPSARTARHWMREMTPSVRRRLVRPTMARVGAINRTLMPFLQGTLLVAKPDLHDYALRAGSQVSLLAVGWFDLSAQLALEVARTDNSIYDGTALRSDLVLLAGHYGRRWFALRRRQRALHTDGWVRLANRRLIPEPRPGESAPGRAGRRLEGPPDRGLRGLRRCRIRLADAGRLHLDRQWRRRRCHLPQPRHLQRHPYRDGRRFVHERHQADPRPRLPDRGSRRLVRLWRREPSLPGHRQSLGTCRERRREAGCPMLVHDSPHAAKSRELGRNLRSVRAEHDDHRRSVRGSCCFCGGANE